MPSGPARSAHRPRARLVLGLALAAFAVVLAGGLWFRARPIEPIEQRPRVGAEEAEAEVRVALEAPVREAPRPRQSPPPGAGVVVPGPLPPPAPPPEPPAPDARRLPIRLEVLDATDGREVPVAWRLRLPRGAAWVEVTETEPTVAFAEEKALLAFVIVPAPAGFVAWEETRIETQVARRATALRHVFPLRPEAVVELSVTGGDGRPVPGTSVSASVAGRGLEVRWAGDASGRVAGVPFLRGARVELTVRHSESPKGEDAEVVREVAWTGRLGSHPREVLRADVVLPSDLEGPANNTLLGVGGSASGAFRGRGRSRSVEDPGRVEVVVLGRDGRPLANTRVGLGGRWSRTDASGFVVFEDVPPGEREVGIEEPGVATARGTVTVESRRTSRLTLREPEGGRLDVEVVDEAGVGLPFAVVSIDDPTWLDVADDGTQRTDPYTDHVGRRSLAHVPAGEVVVRAGFGERFAHAAVEARDGHRTSVLLVVK